MTPSKHTPMLKGEEITADLKLTPAQRKALTWVMEREPVSAFPCDGTAPDLRFVKKLLGMGLVETAGAEGGRFGFTRFRITDAARIALKSKTNEME